MKLIVPIIFAIVMIVFFAFALYFSQYKKRKSGCCGGGKLLIDAKNAGKACDEDESKNCIC
jgi:hypothetical protein